MIPDLSLLLQVSQIGKLLAQTGLVARVVLLILLFFSVFSWAIIFHKMLLFSKIERQTSKFLQLFRTAKGLPEPAAVTMAAEGSPLVAIYVSGVTELHSQIGGGNPHGRLKSLNAIAARMQNASSAEMRNIERLLPWLATTASVSPFIGLFGTVWGVMAAFAELGAGPASTIQVVAPGMAEALIATAAGLFAAIPALVAYNHFLHHLKELGGRMDNFTSEFVAQVEKQYS